MIGVVIAFGASVISSVTGSGQIGVAVQFPKVQAATSRKPLLLIQFTAIEGQQIYTVDDVPELEDAVGMDLKLNTMDSTPLPPPNRNWDGEEYEIIGVSVAGGEDMVLLFKQKPNG